MSATGWGYKPTPPQAPPKADIATLHSDCIRKKAMREEHAQNVVKDMKASGLPHARAYLCPHCCRWHVTKGCR